MLLELRIQGYAVIDDLTVTLSPGLNALTGETGAGKSIVADALALLLGERASADLVRRGAERAVVEAVFDMAERPEVQARLEEMGIADDGGVLVLRREVQAAGRNRAWINGSPATAGTVGELGAALVDLHGQHEHQALLRSDEQRRILDAFAGLTDAAAEVRGLHDVVDTTRKELAEREARARELAAQSDFLRFQLSEIESAQLSADEETALEDEARRLEHARELGDGASRLHEGLYGGDESLADRVAEVRGALEKLARLDPTLADSAAALEEAYHVLADVGRRLGEYAEGIEADPARLDELRRRQELIFRLKRKYGPTFANVLETGRRVRAQLDELEGGSVDLQQLQRQLDGDRKALLESAVLLSKGRAGAARRLGREVEKVLPSLGMEGARFEAQLSPLPEPGPGGAETVAFLVSVNAGFEPRPLARVSSGGELSRVMLALKSILARVDRVPTLVFDEIDAGVGGAVASAVAAELRAVAEHHQVLVITHLPQIASRAHAHLRVDKTVEAGVTTARVSVLGGEDRVREIARMLGGDPQSERSRDHARELLQVG
jgi:DNA repair protein RecN (Recombination protein N)